jgi:hypothetical protein
MGKSNDIIAYKVGVTLLTEGLLAKNKDMDLLDVSNILREIALDYKEEANKYEE